MIESTMDPRLAASVAETGDLDRFKSQMDGIRKNLSGKSPDKLAQLRKACQNFEAVFIGKLWEQMKQSVPKEGYLHSKQEDTYMSMFNKDFSEKMAQAGGIGLADMIYDQLSQKLKQVSDDTLSGGVDIKPLAGGGAPGIPLKSGGEPMPLNRSKGMTLEDWGGSEVAGAGKAAGAGAAADAVAGREPLTDVEVKARLDALTRKLEAQRIREGLAGGAPAAGRGTGYAAEGPEKTGGEVGRKLAKIG